MTNKRQYELFFEHCLKSPTKKRSAIVHFITMNDDRTSIFSHPDFNCRPWNHTKSAMQINLHRSRAEECSINHSS